MTDELAEFETAVVPLIPSGLAVIGGSAVSPDGRYGAILTIFTNAGGLATEWLFEREGDSWVDAGGGSAGSASRRSTTRGSQAYCVTQTRLRADPRQQ